jgi:predicted oxidoreductase
MGQARQPRFGGELSGRAQVAFDHRYAFAVGGDDQHSTSFGGWRDTPNALLFVESVEVLRHTTRDLFRLSFSDFRASVAVERHEDFVERLFGRTLCDHSLDRLRMECRR